MPHSSFLLPTPIGNLEFILEVEEILNVEFSIQAAPVQPKIPQGMTVLACYGVILQVDSPKSVSNLRFKAILKPSCKISSGPSTGEGLEAQEWNSQHHVMLVGTEDLEVLKSRLHHSVSFPNDPFTYKPESLSINIAKLAADIPLSLHFIVAWNELPEKIESSCWFAVDQSHASIVSTVRANPAFERDAAKARRPSTLR